VRTARGGVGEWGEEMESERREGDRAVEGGRGERRGMIGEGDE